MKPYYEDTKSGITIYHGDCREIAPSLMFDAVVADPPYGIALDTSSRWWWLPDHAPVIGDAQAFDPSWILNLNKPTILWGANHYASRLPDVRGWLVWDKATRDNLDLKQAELEIAWTNCVSRPRMLRHMWSGAFRDSERGTRWHPTQKPTALMRWCLGWLPSPCIVLDPYAGSGPTLEAAKSLGWRAIGIEIEERYCEIAARRLDQEVLAL